MTTTNFTGDISSSRIKYSKTDMPYPSPDALWLDNSKCTVKI